LEDNINISEESERTNKSINKIMKQFNI